MSTKRGISPLQYDLAIASQPVFYVKLDKVTRTKYFSNHKTLQATINFSPSRIFRSTAHSIETYIDTINSDISTWTNILPKEERRENFSEEEDADYNQPTTRRWHSTANHTRRWHSTTNQLPEDGILQPVEAASPTWLHGLACALHRWNYDYSLSSHELLLYFYFVSVMLKLI